MPTSGREHAAGMGGDARSYKRPPLRLPRRLRIECDRERSIASKVMDPRAYLDGRLHPPRCSSTPEGRDGITHDRPRLARPRPDAVRAVRHGADGQAAVKTFGIG